MTEQTTPTDGATDGATDSGRAADLLREAQEAAVLRAHRSDPNVIALTVERIRTVVETLMWVGIVLGLAFTTVSVQAWGAAGHRPFDFQGTPDLTWWSMWLLAPLVEIPLLAILLGEQIAGRHGVRPGAWVRRARWALLGFAYLMNTFAPWAAVLGGRWGFDDLIVHSVPPLAVLLAAEAVTDLRETLTRAITRAVETAVADQEKASAAASRRQQRRIPPPPPAPPASDEQEEQASPPPPPSGKGPLGDGRTLRQIGVEWALANWRDDLRPVDIGEALLALGVDCSKGERSRIRDAAAAIVAQREQGQQDQHGQEVESEPVTAGAQS